MAATALMCLPPLAMLWMADAGQLPPFWTLFGTSNQLLAGLSLLAVTVWLRRSGQQANLYLDAWAFRADGDPDGAAAAGAVRLCDRRQLAGPLERSGVGGPAGADAVAAVEHGPGAAENIHAQVIGGGPLFDPYSGRDGFLQPQQDPLRGPSAHRGADPGLRPAAVGRAPPDRRCSARPPTSSPAPRRPSAPSPSRWAARAPPTARASTSSTRGCRTPTPRSWRTRSSRSSRAPTRPPSSTRAWPPSPRCSSPSAPPAPASSTPCPSTAAPSTSSTSCSSRWA